MNDEQDFMNNELVRQIFSDMGEKTHFSHEMIMAWTQGRLSNEGADKVSKHIKVCRMCSDVYNIIKITETATVSTAEGSTPPMSGELKAKLDFVCSLNIKKDELAEKVAKLFLAKESWPSIKPAIVVFRNWNKSNNIKSSEHETKLSAAAFASQVPPQKRKDYEQILNVINFVDDVQFLLAERCKSLDDLKNILPECIKELEASGTNLKLDDDIRLKIENIFLENLSKDENIL
ncbi:MAG: hypothetical protein PHP01_00600 [Phycisphaerae bacterium]|nr:hypothetical protein [Phycisphaerae bacterium]